MFDHLFRMLRSEDPSVAKKGKQGNPRPAEIDALRTRLECMEAELAAERKRTRNMELLRARVRALEDDLGKYQARAEGAEERLRTWKRSEQGAEGADALLNTDLHEQMQNMRVVHRRELRAAKERLRLVAFERDSALETISAIRNLVS